MTTITFKAIREMQLPNEEGKPTVYLHVPWITDKGLMGTLKIEKDEYSSAEALKRIKKELEAPHYQDVDKTFELE